MITDEMVEAVQANVLATHTEAYDVLTAAYPLIRAQVLDEAAAVCDARARKQIDEADLFDRGYRLASASCAQAIRNLAEGKRL